MVAPRYSTDWEALSLRLVFGALAAIAIVFLVAPTLIMLLTSFTASQSLKFPPDGLSLRWYIALLDADQMQAAAWNSLVVAFWTTVVSVVLGTAAALAIARSRSALARACDVLFMSPLLLPALAFGFAALIFIHKLGFAPSIPFRARTHRRLRAVRAAHDNRRALPARSGAARCLLQPRRRSPDDLPPGHAAADRARSGRRRVPRLHGFLRQRAHVVISCRRAHRRAAHSPVAADRDQPRCAHGSGFRPDRHLHADPDAAG